MNERVFRSIEVMFNHPLIDPYNPLLNKNPMDLAFIHHYQNQDQALLKALQEDKHFSKINRGGTEGSNFK